MKKINLVLLIVIGSITIGTSQMQKKVVVEHFTNTRCSVCASRNPGFFSNLNNYPEVIHLSIHPSTPYSNCFLHLHNPSENDARASYYGNLGTPRLVIQGDVISSGTNYGDSTLFTSVSGDSMSINIGLISNNKNGDSIATTIILKSEGTVLGGKLQLYAVVAEETVDYNAPNGEDVHHNVFRRMLFENQSFEMPSMNDSLVFNTTIAIDGAWNENELEIIVIVQDSVTKEVYQSNKLVGYGTSYNETYIHDTSGNNSGGNGTTAISNQKANERLKLFYPNPFSESVYAFTSDNYEIVVYNSLGKIILHKNNNNQGAINTDELDSGIYFFEAKTNNETVFRQKMIKL